MTALSLDRVFFGYTAGRPVLKDLSLRARAGEILAILGVNGAGKSSTFRLVAGLLAPEAGEVRVDGLNVQTQRLDANRRLGFVPDEPLLYPALNALENLNMFAILWGVAPRLAAERAEALLQQCGLWEHRYKWSRDYSRGLRQKLAVCTALIHEPPVLLLDEPFAGLDFDAVLWLRELLMGRARNGSCVVFSAHQPETIDVLADRLAVLHEGRVAAAVDRDELRARGGAEAIFRAVRGSPS